MGQHARGPATRCLDSIGPMAALAELTLHSRGKVREIYELGDDLLLVASDRISAYDVILPDPIPGKGEVLTQMSIFWFELMADVCPNHFISEDVPEEAAGRGMRVTKLEMYPVECVVRGYLSGSGWKEYRRRARSAGSSCPRGSPSRRSCRSRSSRRRRRPRSATTTRTSTSSARSRSSAIASSMESLRDVSIEIYTRAAEHAAERGIILADTKFEFGRSAGRRGRPRRRGPHARLLPLLARRRVRGRARAALVRQAVRARLARRVGLGPLAAGPEPPDRR